MNINREYKASVFSLLFSEPEVLRELYGAIEGATIDPSVPITINTLENAIFLDRVNDISFVVGEQLVLLFEHQSTINPNMPLRALMYIARVYEKIVNAKDKDSIYTTSKLTVPRPEFIVLYNGTDPSQPDVETLKLSASFADPAPLGLAKNTAPELELTVKVYNINKGRNEHIVRRCEKLNGYSAFIDKIREFEKQNMVLEEAVSAAVKWCVSNNVLKDFMLIHGSEVISMLVTEWNWDTALEVRERDGLEKGKKETAKNALKEGALVEFVQKITGLDIETIKGLAAE
jgi:hypothetical protein